MDPIIVFQQFENSILANLAKTKLDAFGVPCFLTEENFSNLYHLLEGGVRLHIFESDRERAAGILIHPSV